MRHVAFLALVLGCAVPAAGGVVYDFVTTVESARTSERVTGRVWAEGDSYRAELVRNGTPVVVISRDADRTATLLDPRKQTWSNRWRIGHDVRSSSLFVWPVANACIRGTPQVHYRTDEPSVIAGRKATQHVIEVSFDITAESGGAEVGGSLMMVARIWTADDLPDLPMPHTLRTGYPAVDAQLAALDQRVRGMIVRHDLEVTRAFTGGPPLRERTKTVVEHLEQMEVAATQFWVPESYEYAGPVTPHAQ